MRKQIQAIIFDLDDTLIDWSKQTESWTEFNRKQANKLYRYLQDNQHFAQTPTLDNFAENFHQHIMAVWTEAKPEWRGAKFTDALQRTLDQYGAEDVSIPTLLRVYEWAAMPGVVTFEDTLDTLEALRQREYRLGLITNSFLPMWMRDAELKAYGLLDYFPHRITSGDTGYMKPHPAIYWRMLGMMNLMPHQAIFVGDRPSNDIAGANDVGLTSVLMKPEHLDYPLHDVVPDYTINKLGELLPILESLQ
jgi:HAD superfamily hydrolase (TIGR01509 family)